MPRGCSEGGLRPVGVGSGHGEGPESPTSHLPPALPGVPGQQLLPTCREPSSLLGGFCPTYTPSRRSPLLSGKCHSVRSPSSWPLHECSADSAGGTEGTSSFRAAWVCNFPITAHEAWSVLRIEGGSRACTFLRAQVRTRCLEDGLPRPLTFRFFGTTGGLGFTPRWSYAPEGKAAGSVCTEVTPS